MTANPVELIGGLTNTSNVAKADIVAWAKARVPQVLADATELRNTVLAAQTKVNIKLLGDYYQDTADTTTADDGLTCIISSDGKRFKPLSNLIGVIRTQLFTSSGTYVPHPRMVYCVIEAAGGGGGGGGVTGSANQGFGGGGGGGAGYSKLVASKATIGASKAIVIGAGGTGSADGTHTGTAGGATTVGSTLVVANGGGGGVGCNIGAIGNPGLGGAVGTGDIALVGVPGGVGDYNNSVTTVNFMFRGGPGGACNFFGPATGSGVANVGTAAGKNGVGNGAGGSGAASCNSATSAAGGNGSGGIVFITEFCSQ